MDQEVHGSHSSHEKHWPNGSGDDKIVKNHEDKNYDNNDGQIPIRKTHLSLRVRWAKNENSGSRVYTCINCLYTYVSVSLQLAHLPENLVSIYPYSCLQFLFRICYKS